jgi:hypothetical protein
MLNPGTRRGDTAVSPFLCLGNVFGRMAAALDVHPSAGLLYLVSRSTRE